MFIKKYKINNLEIDSAYQKQTDGTSKPKDHSSMTKQSIGIILIRNIMEWLILIKKFQGSL